MTIPMLALLLVPLAELGVMALPVLVLVVVMFYLILMAYFRPEADRAQEILTRLWSRHVSRESQ